MRRFLIPGIACLALAGAAMAATGFSTGTYEGKTDQHYAITFKVSKDAVRNLVFKEKGKCSDGRRSSGSQGPFQAPIKKGAFTASGKSPSGAATSHVTGKLSGKKASGTVRLDSRFDDKGKPDPKGTIKCTTGTVKWTATRR